MTQNEELQRLLLDPEFLAGLENQCLGGSFPFDPYLRVTKEPVQNRIDLVLDDLCQDWTSGYLRKPSATREQNFIECAKVILINLLRAHSKKLEETVGIPRSKGLLDEKKRYRPEFMTTNLFLMAQDQLLKAKYMAIVKPGYHFPDNSQVSMFTITDHAAAELEADTLTVRDFYSDLPEEPVILKDSRGQLCRYLDTDTTYAMRTALARINERLSITNIATSHPLTRLDSESDFVGTKVNLVRIFNYGSFEYGGRYYGGWWQSIHKYARRYILLDGTPTVEADYRGFNPAVLLAKAGHPIPADPYSLIPGVSESDDLRNHAKRTLAALINSATGNTVEPTAFNAKQHGMTADQFRQSVLATFPMVKSLLGQKTGMKLQREESDLAERIMLHFVDQGHPILPIHDAFIVQEHLKDELVATMRGVFRDKYGQLPQVSVTSPA